MSDLNAATLLPDADIVDTAVMPIRKGGVAGLWKITLAKLKAYVLGTSFLVPPGGTTGQVLKKASGTDGDIGWGADNVGSGGSTNLDGLTDVDTSTVAPTNGQGLVWDNAAGLWKPGTVASSGGGSATQISARYWGLFEVQPTIGQALVVGRAGFRTVSGGAATVPTTATGSAGAPLGAFNNTANWDTGTSSHDEFAICDFGAAFAPVEFFLTSRTDYSLGYQQMPRSLVLAYSSDGTRWTEHSRYYMNFTAIGQTFAFAIPAIVVGQAGASVGALVKIAQSVVAVATNSVDFTGIPAGYEDLVIVINGQLSGSADFVVVRCNGDATSGNYQYARGVFQNSGLSYSSAVATGLVIGLMGGAVAGASYADMVEASIQSYARTTFYKNARGRSTLRSGTTANAMTIEEAVADWLSTAAVNRLTFLPNSGNFTVGTVITIYGRG